MALYSDFLKNQSRLKTYKRIGIRRDQNLGDLSNSAKGLENILDSLVTDQINESFLISDLNAIKNIFAQGMEPEQYQSIIGSAVQFTTPDGQTKKYDPRITYQNRIDKFKIFSGEPRLFGGNGLTANYYQNDQINFNAHQYFKYTKPNGNPLDPNDSESEVFISTTSEGEIPSDNFWEFGEFFYSGKIHPQSVKANTGVKWEGYYIPVTTGTVDFSIRSTGYYTFDFNTVGYQEDNNGNTTTPTIPTYTSYARVGLSTEISATANPAVSDSQISVDPSRIPTIGIGMTVSGNNITGTPEVSSIDHTTGVVSLSVEDGQPSPIQSSFSNNNLTFFRGFGDQVTTRFTSQVLIAFQKYRIRARYFHPKVENNFVGDILEQQLRKIAKRVVIHHRPPNASIIDHLHHRYLYSMDYNFSSNAKGNFNNYYDKSVISGGTILGEGLGSRLIPNEYVRIKTTNKIDLAYKVKESLEKITIEEKQCNYSQNSKVIPMSITSPIEIGNYIFGVGISEGTIVEDIAVNQFIVLSKSTTASGINENIKFIDHRGFVKKITCDGSGTTLSNVTPALKASTQTPTTIDTDVQRGMVVIGNSSNFNSYTIIDTVNSTTSLTLDTTTPLKQNFTSQDVYIYQSRGLKDNSIQNFCDRFSNSPEVRCLISDHATTDANGNPTTYTIQAGINTVKVKNINGVAANWELQGSYFTTPQDTTASAGIGVESVDTNNNIITLKSGITRPLPDGAQFTAVGTNGNVVNQDGDYQLCCPPTDTSPPFDASEEGLNTTSTYPNFELTGGNLIFDSLIIKDTNSNVYDSEDTNVNRKIKIKTGVTPSSNNGNNFKLLGTTSSS